MNLTVIGVGHKMPDFVDKGVKEYAKRFGREFNFKIVEIKPVGRQGENTDKILDQEADKIFEAAGSGSLIVALDERGKDMTTRELAKLMEKWMEDGTNPTFVIGSADGLSPRVKSSAGLMMRLSSMTLPHAMARLLLVEQLYRAVSIIQNHPYHRD